MNSWRDPSFTYHGAASHASSDAFRRRQKERIRLASEQARSKVKPLPVKTARTA